MELHMFIENKHTTHFATHKNAQSQLVTVQCSLSKCQPEKSKIQLVTPSALICIRFFLHFTITSSHSIRSPGLACHLSMDRSVELSIHLVKT